MEGGPARLNRALAAAMVSRRVGGSAIRRIMTLGGVVAAVLLLLPTLPSAAVYQAMDIMILAPDREYRIGEHVTLTVHVFRAGVHEDATSLAVYLGGDSDRRALNPTRIDTGVYEASFEIFATDAGSGAIRVMVEAWIGSMRDQEVRFFGVEGLEVEVSAFPAQAAPGALVDVTVRVRERGIPCDVDTLAVVANLVTMAGTFEPMELAPTRIEAGTYVATYPVPAALAQDTALSLTAEARARGASGFGASIVLVEVPTGLVVWSHAVSVGPESAVLEILAANGTGWPVSGAMVSLTYGYFNPALAFVTKGLSGETDSRGAVTFEFGFQGARSTIGFWGTVASGTSSQGFGGSLAMPTPELTRRVDARRDNEIQIFVPGERSTLGYTLVQGGTPLPSRTVYYYAHTRDAVIASGVATSDVSGRFTIEFVAPVGYTTVAFASLVGGSWVHDTDLVFAARPLAVKRGEIYVGNVTRVSATLPSGSAPWIAFVAFRPYTSDDDAVGFRWAQASGAWGAYDIVVPTGMAIEHDLVVPRFLPKGAEYLLSIFAFPQTPTAKADALHVYQEIIRIENVPPTAFAVFPDAAVTARSSIEIDASASFDMDGDVSGYAVDWGDGTTTGWIGDARATHVYEEPGEYLVTVRVRDDSGSVSEASQTVRVDPAVSEVDLFAILVIFLLAVVAGTVPAMARRRRPDPARGVA